MRQGTPAATKRPRAQGGFTLLELMLALALFSGAVVAVVELLHKAQAGSNDGEQTLIAAYLAQRRLEELRNTPYASLASEARAAVSSPTGFSRFDREVVVTTPQTNLRQVVVTVYWDAPGPAGETNVTLQTYRSNI